MLGPEQNVILCEVSMASSVSGQSPVRVRLVGPSPAARKGANRRGYSRLEGRLIWRTATAQSAWIPSTIIGRRHTMRICHILGVPPSDSGSQTPALLPQVQDSTLLPHYPRPIPSSKPGSQPQSFSLRPRNPDPTILQTQELTPQTSSADQGLYLRVERVVIICVIVVITGV